MEQTSKDRTRRIGRRVLLIAGGALGIVVLAYGVAAILVHTLLDPATLSSWVEPRAEAALNRDVELGGARIRLFPSLGAELQGLRVANPPGMDAPPLARIESVRLDVAILPLFRRQVRVNEIRLESPIVHLAVDPEGRTNFGDLVPESSEEPGPDEGGPLQLAVRDVTLTGGSLSYVSDRDTVQASLDGLEATASLERSPDTGWRGSVEARTDSLLAGHPGLGADPLRMAGPAVRFRGTAGGEFDWIEIQEGLVSLADAELELDGRVERLKEPVRGVDLALRADEVAVERIVTALPDSARARLPGPVTGVLTVDLRAVGSIGPEDRPELRGEILLAGIGAEGEGGRLIAEDVGGRVEVADGEVLARQLQGTVLDGPFALEGTLRPDSALGFRAELAAAPRLEAVAGLGTLPEGVSLAGELDVALAVEGRLRRIADTGMNGRVDATGIRIEHPRMGVPVTVESGRLELDGQRATWSDLAVDLGEDRIVTTGSAEDVLAGLRTSGEAPAVPRLQVDVQGERLDLDRVLPPRGDTAVTYGRIAFAHVGSRTLEGRTAEEWAAEKELQLPDSLPVAGEARIRLDTLHSAPHRLTDVDARVIFSPALVEVPEATFSLYGGTGRASLRLGIGGTGDQPFAFDLTARDVDAADFLAVTSPLGRHVRGALSLELDLAGSVDRRMLPVSSTLAGTGRMEVEDGGLEENPLTRALADGLSVAEIASPSFSEWTAPFEIEGPALRFTEAAIASGLGPLRYGGLIGLDGALDLGLRLALPATRLDSLALGRSGLASAVAGRLTGDDGPVGVGVGIEGTFTNPSIEPRASLATGDLRRALEDEARERTEEVRDTARARVEAARDTAEARAEEERRQMEERAREEAEEAREELEERARGFLRGLGGGRDTAADTTGDEPPDTTSP